jgi:hypothetical protein
MGAEEATATVTTQMAADDQPTDDQQPDPQQPSETTTGDGNTQPDTKYHA